MWDGRTLYELCKEAYPPYERHEKLFARARELGVTMFSTPFDESAVDLLAALDAPAYKIASFEAVDLPLIAYTAKREKPLIISTGMANLGEISEAVSTARDNGAPGMALLQCVSAYPAPVEDANSPPSRTLPSPSIAWPAFPIIYARRRRLRRLGGARRRRCRKAFHACPRRRGAGRGIFTRTR